jgi:hypothetical protein
VDPADHYLDLVKLGRDAFVASAAPAALIRTRPDAGATTPAPDGDAGRDSSVDLDTETFVGDNVGRPGRRKSRRLEIYPLAKKPAAPFPDMITVGRTPNNDIVLRDSTVSRLHAFFRHHRAPDGARGGEKWEVADGGSKNGTFLDGQALSPRREKPVGSGQVVKIGDLELTFYTAEDLFKLLSLVT